MALRKNSGIPRLETRPGSKLSSAGRTATEGGPEGTSWARTTRSPRTPASHLPVRTRFLREDCAPRKPRDSGISISVQPPDESPSLTGSNSSRPGTPNSTWSGRSQLPTPASSIGRLSVTPSKIKYSSSTRDSAAGNDAPLQSSPSTAARGSPPSVTSLYVHVHVANACVVDSLVHHLSSCNHKIITKKPEPCGSNCSRQYGPEVSHLAKPVVTEAAFLCAACIELHLQAQDQAARDSLLARYRKTASRMPSLSDGFVQKRLDYWDRVLKNDIEQERKEFEKVIGRRCCLIPGEPLFEEIEEAHGILWPPRMKPKENRTPGHQPPLVSLLSPKLSSGQEPKPSRL